jgi:hypothetical protein
MYIMKIIIPTKRRAAPKMMINIQKMVLNSVQEEVFPSQDLQRNEHWRQLKLSFKYPPGQGVGERT